MTAELRELIAEHLHHEAPLAVMLRQVADDLDTHAERLARLEAALHVRDAA